MICTVFNLFVTTFINSLLTFIKDTSFLSHVMLVQIFMGSLIFINSGVQVYLITNFEMPLIKILYHCSVHMLSHCSFLLHCPLSYYSTIC